MLRPFEPGEFEQLLAVINDGAQAYRGVIPADRWSEPYMSEAHLRHELDEGVAFWVLEEQGELLGVMGLQPVEDVTLVRHAYVRTRAQRGGIGAKLLAGLREHTRGPVLIGTWAAARWAIAFYEKHGFRQVDPLERVRLLRRYWTVPERQIETSVVLADAAWFARARL